MTTSGVWTEDEGEVGNTFISYFENIFQSAKLNSTDIDRVLGAIYPKGLHQ